MLSVHWKVDPRLRRSNTLGNALGIGDDTRLCRCIQTGDECQGDSKGMSKAGAQHGDDRGKPHAVALMSCHPNRSKVSVLQARNCPKNQLPDPPNRIRIPRTIAPLEGDRNDYVRRVPRWDPWVLKSHRHLNEAHVVSGVYIRASDHENGLQQRMTCIGRQTMRASACVTRRLVSLTWGI
ncbi:uncharacterized protein EI90DRAFT_3051064 [Cantharellus anzutake]|uniref:uncharacterized protein n=1 Tax=Cantharellus anzutake TaxID=1750568 RepID=UPI00190379F0|nr:uncharacterized protein EI90DRAFT_3051064 [Cantharellus anzutake]KAF8334110.1 hypothetical protein EI90DRAFT_3051064 [Cantharellus anzutake]